MNSPENPVTSYIGRWVAFAVTPLVLAAVAWLSQHGIDVDPAVAVSLVLGIAGALVTWLYNRGKFEAASVSGLSPTEVERIATGAVRGLPPAPQAPPPGADGSPAQPQAPPDAVGPPADDGMTAAERRAEEAKA